MGISSSLAIAEPPKPENSDPEKPKQEKIKLNVPSNYLVPLETIESISIEKELLKPGEAKAWNTSKNISAFRRALKSESLQQSEIQLIRKFARIQVLEFSMKERRKALPKLRQSILSRLNDSKGKARSLYIKELISNIKLLLDGNLQVRLQAVYLLGKLDAVKVNSFKRTPPVPAPEIVPPLLKILKDLTQPQQVRIAAVDQGLYRVCLFGQAKVSVRNEIANGIVKALQTREKNHWWLNRSCVKALSLVNIVYDTTPKQKPFVTTVLIEVMKDRTMTWEVRSAAAHSLGRIKLDGRQNISLIANEILRLGVEMAQVYNLYPRQAHWNRSFGNLYLGFHPLDKKELQKKSGLLEQIKRPGTRGHQKNVDETFKQLIILCQPVIDGKKIPPSKIEAVEAWRKKNQPKSRSIVSNSPPID